MITDNYPRAHFFQVQWTQLRSPSTGESLDKRENPNVTDWTRSWWASQLIRRCPSSPNNYSTWCVARWKRSQGQAFVSKSPHAYPVVWGEKGGKSGTIHQLQEANNIKIIQIGILYHTFLRYLNSCMKKSLDSVYWTKAKLNTKVASARTPSNS